MSKEKSRYKAWGEFVITLDASSETEAEERILEWMDELEDDMDMMNGSVKACDLFYETKGEEK